MPGMRIRAGVPTDFAAIWAINAEGQPGVSPFTSGELATLLEIPARVWVAVDDAAHARVVGYCVTYRSGDDYDGEEYAWFRQRHPAFLYIDQIAVAGTHRRAGIGAQLYAAVEQAARDWDLPALTCEVNRAPLNPASLAFHRRGGFSEVGSLDTRDGRTVALLVKTLTA